MHLARAVGNLDDQLLRSYESQMSCRKDSNEIKLVDMKTLQAFVEQVTAAGIGAKELDGFFFSYKIPQISKEFDLIKVWENKVLNIELKSESVSDDKIKRQLQQNGYYLSHLSRPIILITYIQSENKFFSLKDNHLISIEFKDVIEELRKHEGFSRDGIEMLFTPSMFLVSPINTPQKFLEGNYFLTQQQEEFRNIIISKIASKESNLILSIIGAAGTGKTLLLYDLAKNCGRFGKVCVIHCGNLSAGHIALNELSSEFQVFPVKEVGKTDFSEYDVIIIDEAHRIYTEQMRILMDIVKSQNKVCILGSDSEQTLSKSEEERGIGISLKNVEDSRKFTLSEKIRTNKNMANFIKKMFALRVTISNTDFEKIKVIFANNYEEGAKEIEYLQQEGFYFISHTMSSYKKHKLDIFESLGSNTHSIIGQEFDDVAVVIDQNFYYDENGYLQAENHPCPDYLFRKLLFQEVTRVREKLAIVVINNKLVYQTLVSIICGNYMP